MKTESPKSLTFEEKVLDKMRGAEVSRQQAVELVRLQEKEDALDAERESKRKPMPTSPGGPLPDFERLRRESRAAMDALQQEHADEIAELKKEHEAELLKLREQIEALQKPSPESPEKPKGEKPAKA